MLAASPRASMSLTSTACCLLIRSGAPSILYGQSVERCVLQRVSAVAILVPVIAGDEKGETFVESEAFAPVLKILRALAANDERIIEWFRTKNAGRKPKSRGNRDRD